MEKGIHVGLIFVFALYLLTVLLSDYRGLKKQINLILVDRRERQQQIIENVDRGERPRSRSATPPPSIHKLTFEEPPEIASRGLARISARPDSHYSPSASRGGMNRMSLLAMIPNLMSRSRRK